MISDSHYLKQELYGLIQTDPAIFEFLQQGSLDGIWYWDLENSANEWMSPQFWTTLGYDPADKKHLASEWQELIDPVDLQSAIDNFNKHCDDSNHPYDQIVRYRHKDGSTVWVRCRGIAIRDESGVPVRMLGVHNDLTEQKRIEIELRKSEARLSRLYQSVPIGYQSLNEDGEILEINDSWCTLLGYDREEMVGRNYTEFLNPESKTVFAKNFPALRKSGSVHGIEFDFIKKDGATITVSVNGKVQYNDDGSFMQTHCVLDDISEKKAWESKLHCASRLNESIVHESPKGICLYDAAGKCIAANRLAAETIGASKEQILEQNYHQLDSWRNNGLLEAAKKTIATGQKQRLEIPLTTSYGKELLLDISLVPITLDNEIHLLTMFDDVAKQRESERRNARLSRIIEDSLNEIYLFDTETLEFTEANNAALTNLGYTREELLAITPVDIKPEFTAETFSKMITPLRTGVENKLIFETTHQRRDQSLYDVEVHLQLLSFERETLFVAIILDISKRKQARRELLKSEANYRMLVENQSDMVVKVDTEGRFLFVSPSYCRTFGRKEEALIGKTFMPLVHEEDRESTEKAMARLYTPPHSIYLEQRALTVQGWRWLSWVDTAVLGDDGEVKEIIGVGRDITSKIAAQEALQKSEEKYRQLFENASDSIFVAQDNVIKFSNDKTLELTGFSPEELKQIPFIEMIHPADRQIVMSRHLKRLSGESPINNYTIRVIDKSGQERTAMLNTILINWEERPATLCFLRDITEQKLLEDSLRQAQKMEAVGTLAGGIAHDFNNILASIIGYAELGLDDVTKGSHLEDDLLEILNAGKRARDLVKQILTFARQTDTNVRPVDVSSIAEEALMFLRSSIPTTIAINHNFESHSLVMGDPTQIHQIVMNLVTNAAQAMEEQPGTIEVGMTDVTVDGQSDSTLDSLKPGDYLKLLVSDNGPGIPADIIGSIFEPYFTTKQPGKGTGMGLAMVHGIINNYGGTVIVESTPGERTVFSVFIPLARKTTAEVTQDNEILPTGTESILFVDDELPITKMSEQILSRLGFRVTVRTSSIEALELFRSNPDRFDLVITDMTMPNMNGDQLATELLSIRPGLPIIVSTGYSEKITEESAACLGIKGLIFKPIVKSELARVVRSVLDKAAQHETEK